MWGLAVLLYALVLSDQFDGMALFLLLTAFAFNQFLIAVNIAHDASTAPTLAHAGSTVPSHCSSIWWGITRPRLLLPLGS